MRKQEADFYADYVTFFIGLWLRQSHPGNLHGVCNFLLSLKRAAL